MRAEDTVNHLRSTNRAEYDKQSSDYASEVKTSVENFAKSKLGSIAANLQKEAEDHKWCLICGLAATQLHNTSNCFCTDERHILSAYQTVKAAPDKRVLDAILASIAAHGCLKGKANVANDFRKAVDSAVIRRQDNRNKWIADSQRANTHYQPAPSARSSTL